MYEEDNLFDTDTMREHIRFIKNTHRLFVTNVDNDLKYERNRGRTFLDVITSEASYNLIDREHGFDTVAEDDEDEDVVEARRAASEGQRALSAWFAEVGRLHNAVIECMPRLKTQLMGEQISRQTVLHPDVMKNILEFANAKDPKRIVLDAAANSGVTVPRGGRRQTKRTKRRGTSRARRR
jgi:hypothetical protein